MLERRRRMRGREGGREGREDIYIYDAMSHFPHNAIVSCVPYLRAYSFLPQPSPPRRDKLNEGRRSDAAESHHEHGCAGLSARVLGKQ